MAPTPRTHWERWDVGACPEWGQPWPPLPARCTHPGRSLTGAAGPRPRSAGTCTTRSRPGRRQGVCTGRRRPCSSGAGRRRKEPPPGPAPAPTSPGAARSRQLLTSGTQLVLDRPQVLGSGRSECALVLPPAELPAQPPQLHGRLTPEARPALLVHRVGRGRGAHVAHLAERRRLSSSSARSRSRSASVAVPASRRCSSVRVRHPMNNRGRTCARRRSARRWAAALSTGAPGCTLVTARRPFLRGCRANAPDRASGAGAFTLRTRVPEPTLCVEGVNRWSSAGKLLTPPSTQRVS